MKEDEYYNRPKGCERAAILFSTWFMVMVLLIILAIRCEKKPPECYECTVTTTYYFDGGYTWTAVSKHPVCGVDEDWIEVYERLNTYSNDTSAYPPYQQICNCK